jgi:hypothetical protein
LGAIAEPYFLSLGLSWKRQDSRRVEIGETLLHLQSINQAVFFAGIRQFSIEETGLIRILFDTRDLF